MTDTPTPELKKAYEDIANHTVAECGTGCLNFGINRCCNARYCEANEEITLSQYGVKLERTDHPSLPFMGDDNKCVLEPWQRPKCAIHHCHISALGAHRNKPEWTEEYYNLIDLIDKAESE